MGNKVAYLLGSLNRGGTETLMLDIFRNALANKLDAVCILRKSGVLEKDFINSEVKIIKLPFSKNIFAYLYRLRRVIKTENIRVIHTHQPIDAIFAKLAFLFSDTKVLLSVHEYDFFYSKLAKILLSIALRITHTNIYVSNSQRNYFTEKFGLKPKKQLTIYNGIAINKFESNQIIGDIRAELALDNKTLLIGTVGNFGPVRDQFTLCRFIKQLADCGIEFKFIFIGEKSLVYPERFEECYSYINDHKLIDKVFFLGSRNDVPSLLKQLNTFVYSSDHDTFGIAVVEALFSGIPVFVNDWGVMNEITDHGKLATIYKTKNEIDLLEKFLAFLNNKEKYLERAAIAKLVTMEKFSINNHIMQLKDYYSQCNKSF
jgi:glycosyltransferase involved in cell wall biosynthesis